MTEQAILNAAITALTPAAAALLEDLHQAASAEITRLEANLPAEIAAASSTVQNWTDDMMGAFHRLVALIEHHRGGASATPTDAVPTPAVPAAAATTTPTVPTPAAAK